MSKNSIFRRIACLSLLAFLSMASLAQSETSLSFETLNIKAGETATLKIDLNNPDMSVWMMQFDMKLPKGLSVVKGTDGNYDMSLSAARAPQHAIAANENGEALSVLVYTEKGDAVKGTTGAFVSMKVKADDSFVAGSLNIKNIQATNPSNELTVLGDVDFKLVRVTVADATRKYGEANPEFTYTVLPEGTDLKDKLTFSCEATKASKVGVYDITASSSATDMAVTCINGKLTVTQAPLAVKVKDAERTYGDENPAFELSITGFVNDETDAVLAEKPTVTTTATKESPVGTYDLTATGGKADNYAITEITAGKLTVKKAVLTVTATGEKAYGEENPEFEYTFEGFVNDETEEVVKTKPTASCKAGVTSPVGVYPIKLSGGEADNYTFDYQEGQLTVNKAILTVTAVNAVRTYGAENPKIAFDYSGFVGEDDESVLTSKPEAIVNADVSSSAGSYSIDVTGGDADNYALEYVSGELTIEKAPLKVTVKDATRIYGDIDPEYEFVYEGFVNGEDASAIGIEPVVTSTASIDSPVGVYETSLSEGEATNYYFNEYVGGKLTVTKAPLLIKAYDKTRYVNEENPELTLYYEGFMLGEDESVLTEKPQVSTDATKDSPTGEYVIMVTGGQADNYEIELVNGTLTITEPKETFEEKDGNYEVEDEKTVTFTGTTETVSETGTCEIPATIEHDGVTYDVTAIASDAFQNETSLTSVTIPASVTSIGESAFAGCTNLETIFNEATEPVNLEALGSGAGSVFMGVDFAKCKLIVPDESVLKYKSAPVWKEFGDNIIGITEYTGMTLTTAFARPVDVYDLRGRKVRSQATSLSGLPKGVYIVNGRKLVK